MEGPLKGLVDTEARAHGRRLAKRRAVSAEVADHSGRSILVPVLDVSDSYLLIVFVET